MNELKEKIALLDLLTILIVERLKLHWDDDNDCLADENGKQYEWDDFDSIVITPIMEKGHTYNQINYWGDGTIEFQDEEESTCWEDFPNEFLEKVINVLQSLK